MTILKQRNKTYFCSSCVEIVAAYHENNHRCGTINFILNAYALTAKCEK
jgi:hypothetical protein